MKFHVERRWVCLSAMIGLYVGFFTILSVFRYGHFLYYDWDLAIYNQAMRGLIHAKPFISLAGVPFLGTHLEVILLAVVPFYVLFPHPLLLLIFQTVMLGAAAVPLFLIARLLLRDERWALAMAALYLAHPAVAFTNLNEFHPESFQPFIQFFMLYFFLRRTFRPFAVFALLCVLSKENMPLIVIMVGLYAFFQRREKAWVLFPVIAGLAWFLFYLKIYPLINQGRVVFLPLYGHLGKSLFEIAASLVLHPVQAVSLMLQPRKIAYLNFLFGPAGYLSVLSPGTLCLALPNFLQHLLSMRPNETDVNFYYASESLAIVFVAAVEGLGRLRRLLARLRHSEIFCAAVLIAALVPSFAYRPYALAKAMHYFSVPIEDRLAPKEAFIRHIPEGEGVVASFEFLPHLSGRTDHLYSFHNILIGKYQGGQPFILPQQVAWVLVNFNDPLTFQFSDFFALPKSAEHLRRFFEEGRWAPVMAYGNTVLFSRNAPARFKLLERRTAPGQERALFVFGGNLELVRFDVDQPALRAAGELHLSFLWRLRLAVTSDCWLVVRFAPEGSGKVLTALHPFCYRLLPPQRWQPGEEVAETYRWFLPRDLPIGRYRCEVAVLDAGTGKFASALAASGGGEEASWMPLFGVDITEEGYDLVSGVV